MNKRARKASRKENDFQRDWYLAERLSRLSYVNRETGLEWMQELIDARGYGRGLWN